MTHQIIKTDNYLLVVDESEIKAGDFYLLIPANLVLFSRSGLPINIREWAKIIYHLPLNNAPILEGVPLLPPLEDEADKLAEQHLNSLHNDEDFAHPETYDAYNSFKEGYNKAKEKYKFTKEDMMKAMEFARTFSSSMTDNHYIQSLQQPKCPVAFECEMKCGRCYMPLTQKDDCWSAKECRQGSKDYPDLPKTITNSQGLTQLVGKYIY